MHLRLASNSLCIKDDHVLQIFWCLGSQERGACQKLELSSLAIPIPGGD